MNDSFVWLEAACEHFSCLAVLPSPGARARINEQNQEGNWARWKWAGEKIGRGSFPFQNRQLLRFHHCIKYCAVYARLISWFGQQASEAALRSTRPKRRYIGIYNYSWPEQLAKFRDKIMTWAAWWSFSSRFTRLFSPHSLALVKPL